MIRNMLIIYINHASYRAELSRYQYLIKEEINKLLKTNIVDSVRIYD